ncbi:MAG: sugar transferase [bacterium]|nr:sugar transferase [bacterium]
MRKTIQSTIHAQKARPARPSFGPRNSWKWRLWDVTAAGSMLLIATPLLVAVYLVVLLVDGKPVFYRGRRLGRNEVPFTIYKFRSLRIDAEQIIGGALLEDTHDHKTRTGLFLRETRLDELPQLVLVLTGKMALFGPRPERPEVYVAKCKNIDGYAERFLVSPGLFGYSQILTPHSTPKRVRALIDRRFVHVPRPLKFEIALLWLTLVSLMQETGLRVARFTKNLWRQRILQSYQEKRRQRRIQPAHLASVLVEGNPTQADTPTLIDMTGEYFLARGPGSKQLVAGKRATLLIREPNSTVIHRARIQTTHAVFRINAGLPEVVVQYRPWSENSNYFIEQYLLDKSIVQLPRAMRKSAFQGA